MAPGQNHRVVIGDDATGAHVVADAVKFVRGAEGTILTIDNTAAGASSTGTWSNGGWKGGGLYQGGNYAYHRTAWGTAAFTWTPSLALAHGYRVYARWIACSCNSANATYTVHHAGGATPVVVDQKANGGRWVLLGDFNFEPGQNHRVVLGGAADGEVVADAVKFVPVPDLPPVKRIAADAIRLVANDAEAASIRYVHADHLGTPRKMTDASGAVVWDAAFTPFGVEHSIVGTATNNNRFPGQYFDAETALHYNYWRDYDPTVGRYIQSDPIGLRAGMNTYAYVFSSPTNLIDKFGLLPECISYPLGKFWIPRPGGTEELSRYVIDTFWDVIPLGPEVGPNPGKFPLGVDIGFKVRRNQLLRRELKNYINVDIYNTTLHHCWEILIDECEGTRDFWEDWKAEVELLETNREYGPAYSVIETVYGKWYKVTLPWPFPLPWI